jgi:hypothetical protein
MSSQNGANRLLSSVYLPACLPAFTLSLTSALEEVDGHHHALSAEINVLFNI